VRVEGTTITYNILHGIRRRGRTNSVSKLEDQCQCSTAMLSSSKGFLPQWRIEIKKIHSMLGKLLLAGDTNV